MNHKEIKIIKREIAFFITASFVSGLTAIPIDIELSCRQVNGQYPFLLLGYDWLAFAHFVLAILLVGPYKDPIKNIWVIEFGLIDCVLIFPLAFIAGHFRGIPIGWQLFDCSFGVFGFIPLWICYQKIKNPEIKKSL